MKAAVPYASLRFLVVCSNFALVGCGEVPKAPQQNVPDVRREIPAPPAAARYLYERTLHGSSDLGSKPGKSALLKFLDGREDETSNFGEGLSKPYAVAAHHGRVYVSNTSDRHVSVFDIENKRFFTIGADGAGVLRKPLGLSVDSVGNLFVADAMTNFILEFDRDGRYLRSIGGPKWFSHLTSVTADPKGDRIYGVDSGSPGLEDHRVRVFDPVDGRHLFDFGTRGSAPGKLNVPYDLAVGKAGRLYVVDSGNFRVQIFDHAGKYLKSFGTAGKRPGQFSRPKEIAADADGNVYVVDAMLGNFQVFDPDGVFLFAAGSHGDDGATLKYMLPSGIGIDEDGKIYFVDQWYGKMDIFRPIHRTLSHESKKKQ